MLKKRFGALSRARACADDDRHSNQCDRHRCAAGRRADSRIMGSRSDQIRIEFEDVTVTAGTVTILKRVTLAFASGLPTVLIGPNGAGKTTLLRTAMGLIAPSGGRIRWAGETTPAAIRQAIVFQRPAMLRRSVAGNIRYALKAAGIPRSRRRAEENELLAR